MKHVSVLLMAILALGCVHNPPKSELSEELVKSHLDKMLNGYIEKDLNAVIESFTTDAKMLEDGGPILNSKAEIKEYTQFIFENADFVKGSSEIIEIKTDMNMAYEISYFNLTQQLNDSTTKEFRWKHLSIWTKANDRKWQISRLIYNDVQKN